MRDYLTLEEEKALLKLERIHLAQDKAEARRNALRCGWSDETACEVASEFGNAFRILILKYGLKDFALLADIVRTVEVTGEA